ncbi:MAG: hypothetical protein U1E62_09000 [Alsobacter sp.]
MRTALAALALVVLALPARADGCSDQVVAMRAANAKYRTAAGDLAAMQRDLGPVGRRSEEQVLRSVRRYGLAIRDLREQRARIASLYHDLVEAACEPFDQQGLEQTVRDFQSYNAQEERIYDEARRLAGVALVTN